MPCAYLQLQAGLSVAALLSGEDPEACARLGALAVSTRAQVAADDSGFPQASAAGLVHADEKVLADAARHAFCLGQPFDKLTPDAARKIKRAGRRRTGTSASRDTVGSSSTPVSGQDSDMHK